MTTLGQGDWRAELTPQVGGGIAALTWRGIDVLRPAPAGASDALQLGCFPLVPFVNRIAGGVLRFDGREIRLPHSDIDLPNALHGHGWRKPWTVAETDARSATLTFEHEADEWPWSYSARQSFALGDDGLEVRLALANGSDRPMPCSLGWHPYFPVAEGERLKAPVGAVWRVDDGLLPVRLEGPQALRDWTGGAPLAGAPFIDNCYTGWTGHAEMERAEVTTTLHASPDLRFLHVYLPGKLGLFCAEPVSAMPDAFNRPEPPEVTGARTLAPGETWEVWMRIGARPGPR